MSQIAGADALWILVEDLFFRAKVEALAGPLGRPARFYKDAASLARDLEAGAGRPAVIVVELGTRPEEGLALLERLGSIPHVAPTLAFYAHVDDQLRRRALELGANRVVPRSAFVRRFGELIAELATSSAGESER